MTNNRKKAVICIVVVFLYSLCATFVSIFLCFREKSRLEREGFFARWSQALTQAVKREEAAYPVDVVFTWVNGSDEKHAEQFLKFTGKKRAGGDFGLRYNEYGLLRFALRSVDKYMPFARKLHVVTNGQVPSWWNNGNKKAAIVTHQQIFMSADDYGGLLPIKGALPTFNSNAIEANLHNIPGLSKHFLYMNDDFLLIKPLETNDIVDVEAKQLRVGLTKRKSPLNKKDAWSRTVDASNTLLNKWYHPDDLETPHNLPSHVGYPMDRDILKLAAERWKDEYMTISRHRSRNDKDLAIPFLTTNLALEEGAATPTGKVRGRLLYWGNSMKANQKMWGYLTEFKGKSVCLNDKFTQGPPSEEVIADLEEKLCSLFPERSAYEDPDSPNPCDKYNKPQHTTATNDSL